MNERNYRVQQVRKKPKQGERDETEKKRQRNTQRQRFLGWSMEIRKFEMTSTGESLGDVSVRIRIVQGDSLLLYYVMYDSTGLMLRKMKASYEWRKTKFQINYLLFMDDITLFRKNRNQIDTLVESAYVKQGYQCGVWFVQCDIFTTEKGKIVKQED